MDNGDWCVDAILHVIKSRLCDIEHAKIVLWTLWCKKYCCTLDGMAFGFLELGFAIHFKFWSSLWLPVFWLLIIVYHWKTKYIVAHVLWWDVWTMPRGYQRAYQSALHFDDYRHLLHDGASHVVWSYLMVCNITCSQRLGYHLLHWRSPYDTSLLIFFHPVIFVGCQKSCHVWLCEAIPSR